MGNWNKWLKYTLYVGIGIISGIVSSYDLAVMNVELVYKPPLVFWAANILLFYNLFENLERVFILLLVYYAIYLLVTFPFGGLLPLSMPIGGALTLWSYRIIGINIKGETIAISSLILFVLGALELSKMLYFREDGDSYPNYFYMVICSWQTVVLTTAAISAQNAKEEEVEQDEPDN